MSKRRSQGKNLPISEQIARSASAQVPAGRRQETAGESPSPPTFKTSYQNDGGRHGTPNGQPSLTKQAFADEVNVNSIIRRMEMGGVMPPSREVTEANYGDFITEDDYHSAMCKVVNAQQQFEALPAELRQEFGNDPGKFLSFASDEDNWDEMEAMGFEMPDRELVEAAEGLPDDPQVSEDPQKREPAEGEPSAA